MQRPSLTRRRFITIAAAAAGAALAGRNARADDAVRWRGSALGAQVSIEIHHGDRAAADRLVRRSLAEVRRLENLFSLYQSGSAISTLNRTGILVAPDPDMVALLRAALSFAELTGGAFDPTVQPLWQLYAAHFSAENADPNGPSAARLAQALAKVGHDGVLVSTERVALKRRGAGVTLNGIAQGYVTDRVADLLRGAGLSTTLIDMGEVRALGARPDGTPWRIGLADADRPGRLSAQLAIVDRAVATTSGAGFRFDSAGRFTHLFDPATGRSPSRYRSLSVVAPTATEADALSTAFSLMDMTHIRTVVAKRPGLQVRAIDADGAEIGIGV